MEISRRCKVCKNDVNGKSFAKHLRSKKLLEGAKQNILIIPENLLKEEPKENKIKNVYTPKPLKQIARENNKIDHEQLNKELAKKMINPY